MKLKLWVKVTLVLLITFSILMLLHNQGNKAVEQCIQQGYSKQYCELKVR